VGISKNIKDILKIKFIRSIEYAPYAQIFM
jgi:hypothetical protein